MQKAPPGQKIKSQLVAQLSERKGTAAAIRHQPNLGHAAIVQQFLKIIPPELLLRRFEAIYRFQFTRHAAHLIAWRIPVRELNMFLTPCLDAVQ